MWYLAVTALACLCGYLYVTIFSSSGSEYEDNSIDAFIIEGSSDETTSPDASNIDKYRQKYTFPGKQILILYGTEYGFSEEVSRLLWDRVFELSEVNSDDSTISYQPRLVNAKEHSIIDWSQEQICFLVISTSGDGVPPTEAREFYNDFLHTQRNLSHLSYSLLALGDSNYPQFCKTGRTLDSRFLELGAKQIVQRQDIDMEDWTVINTWIQQVQLHLKTARLDRRLDYLQYSKDVDEGYTRTRPFLATLKIKKCLTVCTSPEDKETIHCQFDISGSGLTWTSGDALGIYPTNDSLETSRLVSAMKCSGREMVPRPATMYKLDTATLKEETLTEVLMKCYDLKTVKSGLLEALKTNMIDDREKKKLEDILFLGSGKDNEVLQEYLCEREVADVLEDFPSHTLTAQQTLKHMKLIQPRYYSISSSPLLDDSTVCVTAAVVKYRSFGIPRTGVTTTYLSYRCDLGQKVPVFMSRNPDFRLPSNHTLPIILIGPGTGIAPFRAFLQETGQHKNCGSVFVYFGCRHKDKDYLYREELERWKTDGVIRLRVAFSRDQVQKIYVQDLLLEDQKAIWKAVHKDSAHIYVCGDAKHMAHDVHRSLLQIAEVQGGMNQTQAEDFFTHLEQQSRYQKDVWIT